MKLKFFILAIFIFLTQPLLTKIYEIHSMSELTPYITQTDGLLVVFDVDSTILKLYNSDVTVPWFCNELEMLQKSSAQSREKIYKNLLSHNAQQIYNEYTDQLINTRTELAEASTGRIISMLFERHVPFLIETRRGFPHIETTHIQLDAVGISHKTFKQWENISYALTEDLEMPAYYDNGILFSGLHTTKGDALKALLKKVSYKPKRLVAVDDQRDNLVSFEKMAHDMGIEFIGLRYGFLDEFTKKSDPRVFDPLKCDVAA